MASSLKSAFALFLAAASAGALSAADPVRGPLRVGCSPDAPDYVQRAAQRLADAAGSCAVLKSLKGEGPLARGPISLSEKPESLAYSHLVVVGAPDDPLVRKAQRYIAKFDGKGGVYVFGFGAFKGDLGYVESGANPLLHSEKIPRIPFETQLVTVTGTTPAGLDAAVDALIKDNLANGLVAPAREGAWTRTEETLLDRPPLVPGKLPATGFRTPAGWSVLGVYDCPQDVCLGVKDATRQQPVRAVLTKYTRPGELDGAGNDNAFRVYLNGLDRHAYGNAVLTLFFADEAAAAAAEKSLSENGRVKASRQPGADGGKLYPIAVTRAGDKVYLSTLP